MAITKTTAIRRRLAVGAVVLAVVGASLALTLGDGDRADGAPAVAAVAAAAAQGHSRAEVKFVVFLGEVDARLVEHEPVPALFTAGQASCADFGKGDSERQVNGTELAVARRTHTRLSAVELGELVPVAVLELCPAYLSDVVTSID